MGSGRGCTNWQPLLVWVGGPQIKRARCPYCSPLGNVVRLGSSLRPRLPAGAYGLGFSAASASDTARGRRWGPSHARSARSAAAPRERVEIQRGAITDRRRAGRVLGGRCPSGSRARHPYQKHPQSPRALIGVRCPREAELCAKQRKASRSWARASAAPGSDGHPPSAAWPYSGPPAPRTRSRCRSLGCRTPRVARSCTHRLRWQP